MQRFAIVGAANAERNDPSHKFPFSPKVDLVKSSEAARSLGAALAKRRHGLIVYDARFIEAEVVSAYVAENPQPSDGGPPIIIRQPHGELNVPFAEEQTHPALFERVADSTGRWEVSFYRSLADADGLILIGGANSTAIAGQVAIGARVPVLALMKTGGAADTIHKK